MRARNSGAAPSGPAGCPPGYQRRADHQQRVLPDRWVHPTKSGKRITDCADDELTCGTGAADVCPAARPAPEPRQTQHRGTVIVIHEAGAAAPQPPIPGHAGAHNLWVNLRASGTAVIRDQICCAGCRRTAPRQLRPHPLRRNGLIVRVEGRNLYRLTADGQAFAIFYTTPHPCVHGPRSPKATLGSARETGPPAAANTRKGAQSGHANQWWPE